MMERILRRLKRKCEGIWFRFVGEPHCDGAVDEDSATSCDPGAQ